MQLELTLEGEQARMRESGSECVRSGHVSVATARFEKGCYSADEIFMARLGRS